MKKKAISDIVEIIKKYQLSSTEFRYISAQARNQTGLIIPKRSKKLPDFLNASEIYTFVNKAVNKNALTGVLSEFLIFTGLRISEARNLQIQDIDFDNNQLKVVQGKGSKDRHVPLTSNLAHKLKLFLNGRKRGYVFCKADERPFTVRALQLRVTDTLFGCDFSKNLSTHSLRHTFACLCLTRGMKLEQIKLLMGHSSIKTTEIYAKLELGSIKNEFLSLMDYR